ncbi:MAG: heme-binding protein [Gammaproteobacteria bacterium]|nr:MAG: heme-binding protein [Gammaproteobacteria bacterium]
MKLSRKISIQCLALALVAGLAAADEHALFTTKSLTPETAMKAVAAAMKQCRDDGYQVAVAVVDRMGNMQAMLRDRYAGAHTPETARRKAWTATSFRTNTTDLIDPTQAGQRQSGVRHVTGALMLGGGVLIDAGGSLVGAIGVSGAPNGEADDVCAKAGIAAIEDDISF